MNLKFEHTDKLSDRDRKLLLFLAVFVLIVGVGGFILRPLAASNLSLRTQVESARAEQQENQEKIQLLPGLQQENDNLKQSCSDAGSGYYSWMESQEIDQLLTGMALERGLGALDLTITMPTAMQDLSPYGGSGTEESQSASAQTANSQTDTAAASSAAGESSEAAVQTDTTLDTSSNLYTAEVSMTLEGDAASLQSMLDELVDDQASMRLTSFSWGRASVVQGDALSDVTTLTVGLELYMLKAS